MAERREQSREEEPHRTCNMVVVRIFWVGLLLFLLVIPGTRSLGRILTLAAIIIFLRLKLQVYERRAALLGHPLIPWLTYALLTIPGPYVVGAVGSQGFLTSVWRWNALLWFFGMVAYFSPPAGWYKAGRGYWTYIPHISPAISGQFLVASS